MSLRENLILVGSNTEVTSLLQVYLSAQGYEIGIISWEENLVDRVKQQKPTLVILTVESSFVMRTSLELFQHLRDNLQTWYIPVIFVVDDNVNSQISTLQRSYKIIALELGADEFITIPFDIEELRLRIRNIFHQRTRPTIKQSESSPKILIVEDDIDISEMLNSFFTLRGYTCKVTAYGLEALEICRKSLPDLVLLDIMLPGIDGYVVCRELRADAKTAHIPIIFLTQKDEQSDIIEGLELSADDYITKPFSIEELLLKVNTIIKRQHIPYIANSVSGMLHQIESSPNSNEGQQNNFGLPRQESNTDLAHQVILSTNRVDSTNQVTTLADARLDLKEWWFEIKRRFHNYSCYGIFLILPSDKEASRYLRDFGIELDTISRNNCAIIFLGDRNFNRSNINAENWENTIRKHIALGGSVEIAHLFEIRYDQFPCLILFEDIESERHIAVFLKGMTAEEIAEKLRTVFSVIQKSVSNQQNPLTTLGTYRNNEKLLKAGKSIVTEVRGLAGKSVEMVMEALIKATIK